jgi:ComF family protein
MATVDRCGGWGLGLVFPEECRVCDVPLRQVARYPVCHDCLQSIEPLQADYACQACRAPFLNPASLDSAGICALCRLGLHGFDAAHSYGSYEGGLRRLIHLLKYDRIPTLAEPLGRLLLRALPREPSLDAVTAVPMHWWRQWRRGFNQAELLGAEVSRRTGIPLERLLRRHRSRPPQSGLTNAARRRNAEGVFRVMDRRPVEGKHVLLVDDVLTTGATASACARALKRAGARRVTVLTLARADRRTWMAQARGEPHSSLQGASL